MRRAQTSPRVFQSVVRRSRGLMSSFKVSQSMPLSVGVNHMNCAFIGSTAVKVVPHAMSDLHGPRTHSLREVHEQEEGSFVKLTGWVQRVRPMSNMFFLVLRDHTGTVQCVWEEQDVNQDVEQFLKVSGVNVECIGMEGYKAGYSVSAESVVSIFGRVQHRPASAVKTDQTGGKVEIRISSLSVLNAAAPMPVDFLGTPSGKDGQLVRSDEELLLKYRFLDLRRPDLQQVLRTRSAITLAAREAMSEQGFYEVETPMLVKSTPEGAREFLVPSRAKGRFYALPQSPQQHKQLLMAAGVDRYFQVARCFRDESGRVDRQPEFTQLDLEMSFCEQSDVMGSVETMVGAMFRKTYGTELGDIPQVSYSEVMNRFGSDKPDVRYSLELQDVSGLVCSLRADGLLKDSDALVQGLIAVNPTYFNIMKNLKELGECSENHLTMDASGVVRGSEGQKLARDPLPTAKVLVLRDQGTFLSGSRRKHITDSIIREVTNGSHGMRPLVVNTAKFAWKNKENATCLEIDCSVSHDTNSLLHGAFQKKLVEDLKLGRNDFVIALSGDWERVCNGLGKGRTAAKEHLPESHSDLSPATINGVVMKPRENPHVPGALNSIGKLPVFIWVVDFPLFEANIPPGVFLRQEGETVEVSSTHHPFTSCHPQDMQKFKNVLDLFAQREIPQSTESGSSDLKMWTNDRYTGYPLSLSELAQLLQIRAIHYDLVSNGLEIGGGSVRLHNSTLQRGAFDVLQVPHGKFRHLLEALDLGCPPHGGFAAGLDRVVAIFASQGAAPLTLRDVIAFPKSIVGNDLLLGSPNPATDKQLREYHITVAE